MRPWRSKCINGCRSCDFWLAASGAASAAAAAAAVPASSQQAIDRWGRRGFGCRMRERLDLFRLRGLGEHIGHHGPRRTHWPSRPHWPWHKDLVRYLAAERGASINAADATVNGSTTWWCQALHSRRRHQPYLLLRIALWALLTVFLATMAETWLQQVFTPQSSPEQTRQVQCGKDLPSCSFTGPWLAFAACAGSTILTRAARPGHPLRHRRAIGFRSLTSCTELAVT